MVGDWNLARNPDVDTYNYKQINNPRVREIVLEIMAEFDLTDNWREENPDEYTFTWRRNKPLQRGWGVGGGGLGRNVDPW